MTITHVPVLAGELIDALDPQPGDIVVDCTVTRGSSPSGSGRGGR
jgi:16S rRNA (cytosine1402-N4)-methyltransferase